ncbi:MAG: AI-2E family transporter [Anaerolineae bacterium]|nr:AI-2E family transporter [Anaerolineae bacterium]MCI0611290.1 AI-2E family transporter [Anaerolineae bacterium]
MNRDSQWSLAIRYIVGIIFLIALIAFIFYAREAMRNLVIAAFVAYLINPAVEYLSKRMIMTRTAAVNLVYFSSLILLVGVPSTLAPIFYDEAQIVIQDLLNLSSQLSNTLAQPVRIFGLVFHLEEWAQSLNQVQGAFLTPLPEQALQILETTSVGVLWFVIILVSVHIFLSEWPNMRDKLFSFVQEPYRAEAEELYRRVRRIWMAYLRGQIVLMVIVGAVFTITWLIMGIPGALVLGVIAGLFTLVPDVGPFLAVVIAAGVALLEGSTWIPLSNFWVAGILVIVYLVLISLKNFFLRPIIMGRSVHMNEALVLIAILIATILEGVLGALLVVPVLASAIVIAGYIQRRVLGLPPFEGDGSTQFVAPPEKIHPPRREWRRKNDKERLDKEHAVLTETVSDSFESEATLQLEPQPDPKPAQEKIEK